jgi:flagellar biosynthesis/type III secretory pathway M-ring protein FliF/YscJ
LKTEYLVSKTTQETEDRLGTIERITVAALVDLNRPVESPNGVPETAMSLADVQDIIKKAVGFKSDRDEIKVIQVRMPDVTSVSSAIDEEWAKQQQWQQILSVVRNSSLGVTALAGVLLAWILLRKRSGAANSAEGAKPPGTEENAHLERIASVLERNPQAVSKVLMNWLNEPEEATRKAA